MIDGLPLLYWHWNLHKSGQGLTVRFTKSHTTSEGILGLHNCAVADKGSIDGGESWD